MLIGFFVLKKKKICVDIEALSVGWDVYNRWHFHQGSPGGPLRESQGTSARPLNCAISINSIKELHKYYYTRDPHTRSGYQS